jgi:hypothetical protein
MKKICRAAILTVCLGAFGGLTAQAQSYNTAYGTSALHSNTTGSYNAAFGYAALFVNTAGYDNTATGSEALLSNTTGNQNTAFGSAALESNTTGSYNTAAGTGTMINNTTGIQNTAVGNGALYGNTTGSNNDAFGVAALGSNDGGSNDTAFGNHALYSNTTGFYNTAVGEYALFGNRTGANNTATGFQALYSSKTGSYNTAIGYGAGYYTTGSWNIDVGSPGVAGDNGVIRIGQSGYHKSFYVTGVNGVPISGPVPVYINSNGQLGTVNSSIRFKEDVHDMADASNGLLKLRPVTYRYKEPYADGSKPIDYGLIAEEVAEVYPDMVVRDAEGQVQTVQYQKLTPMLLNEVQKQHQLLAEQKETIQQQEERLAALEAALASGRH